MKGREYTVILMDTDGGTIAEIDLLVKSSKVQYISRMKNAASALIIPTPELRASERNWNSVQQ